VAIVVMVVTLLLDLAIAVACGIVVAALVYGWDSGETVVVTRREIVNDDGNDGSSNSKTIKYYVNGPIFFASVKIFLGQFDLNHDEGGEWAK